MNPSFSIKLKLLRLRCVSYQCRIAIAKRCQPQMSLNPTPQSNCYSNADFIEFESCIFLYRSRSLAGPDGLITRGIHLPLNHRSIATTALGGRDIPGVFMVDTSRRCRRVKVERRSHCSAGVGFRAQGAGVSATPLTQPLPSTSSTFDRHWQEVLLLGGHLS